MFSFNVFSMLIQALYFVISLFVALYIVGTRFTLVYL